MPEPFKERLGADAVAWIARGLDAPGFDAAAFTAAVLPRLPALELKDRVALIADALHEHLSGDFPQDLARVVALARTADASGSSGFCLWPLTAFVERHGLEHPEASLDAMHTLTQAFSCEFAIRPFLLRHPDLTLARLDRWVEDPSPAVRRLVSEGTRTHLPWGMRLRPFILEPGPVFALLERLRADPDEVVRRSVANSLNDLSRDHAERVVDLAARWLREVPGAPMRRLVQRALRSLVKQGHAGALAVMGVEHGGALELGAFTASPRVQLGEALLVRATLRNPGDRAQAVVLDLVLHLRKADGKLRPKVFKWTRLSLPPGGERTVEKRLPLRPVTTRTHHAGRQRVEVQANGVVLGGLDFELDLPPLAAP